MTLEMALFIKLIPVMTLLPWSVLTLLLSGRSFDFDTTGARYSFHSVFAIYRQIYAGIAVFGGVLATVMLHGGVYRIILALSSVYALFFVLWLTFQYESYQHRRYIDGVRVGRSPYTGWKYALTLVFGVMSPLLFAVGLVGMAYGQ